MKAYTGWLGPMDHEWKYPPPAWNPDYDPKAKARYARVSASMEKDGFYDNHSREECATEWRRRYDKLKEEDNAQPSRLLS